MHYLYSLLALLLATVTYAQAPTPAPAQSVRMAITNATIHVGDGTVIENGTIVFNDGKIESVGTTAAPAGTTVVDGKGGHVYPGFIAPNTKLGLVEIDAVRSTRDFAEVGSFNPSVRSIIAYNTESNITPTLKTNGVLLAQITPQGGRISGLSSVVQLDAWNWEDATIKTDQGMHVNWPSRYRRNWRAGTYEKNKNYEEQVRELRGFMDEAAAYAKKPKVEAANLRFAALGPVLSGERKLYVHAQRAQDIMDAVLFGKSYGADVVLVGGRDSWMVTDFLKAQDVPVILGATQALPYRGDEDIDQPFKTPAMLQAAGVDFCLGMEGAWEQRNLLFQAGQAVAFGLEYEQAVAALTSNAARILGVEDMVGTLKAGHSATLFLSTGDALDPIGTNVTRAFIDGRDISVDTRQKALYRKYSGKYENE